MEMRLLKNTHKGETCVVMGCGPSVLNLQPYLDKCFKIGVNDIGDFCDPDLLLILDEKSAFAPHRVETIVNTRPQLLASNFECWDKLITAPHNFFNIITGNRGMARWDEDISKDKMPVATTSTYCAVILAYYMGFKKIGMIGVDFTQNHYNNQDGVHTLNKRIKEVNQSYELLYKKLKGYKVEFWNLSKESIINVPKMDLDTFFNQ